MDTLESIGMFTAPPDAAITNQTMYALDDTNVSAELRAKSYLHSNCAHCHQPNGLRMDFRFETPLADMDICDVEPSDNLGITNARLFAPGDVERSIILSRINRTDESRMPPLATNIIDMDAVEVISDWIESVSSCQ